MSRRSCLFVGSRVSDWVGIEPINRSGVVAVEYLVIAGGGGGAGAPADAATGGGGGAGGYLTGNTRAVKSSPLTLTVGAGGTGSAAAIPNTSSNGGDSTFDTVTCVGGGMRAGRNLIRVVPEVAATLEAWRARQVPLLKETPVVQEVQHLPIFLAAVVVVLALSEETHRQTQRRATAVTELHRQLPERQLPAVAVAVAAF